MSGSVYCDESPILKMGLSDIFEQPIALQNEIASEDNERGRLRIGRDFRVASRVSSESSLRFLSTRQLHIARARDRIRT
jgi:hypothetical protein